MSLSGKLSLSGSLSTFLSIHGKIPLSLSNFPVFSFLNLSTPPKISSFSSSPGFALLSISSLPPTASHSCLFPLPCSHYSDNNRRRSSRQRPADPHATCQPSIGILKASSDFAPASQEKTRGGARLFHVAKWAAARMAPNGGSTAYHLKTLKFSINVWVIKSL